MPIVVEDTTTATTTSNCTFARLLTELYARGFNYLNQDAAGQTRAKNWINEAYLEDIATAYPWDFLRASVSDTAPLSIADVGQVVSVVNTTTGAQLDHADLRELVDDDPALATLGTPAWWYVSAEQTLSVYPLNTTDTITVNYYKVPTELVEDDDQVILPRRWCGLIVDAACIRAYLDSDNFDAATALQQHVDARLQRMAQSELVRSGEPEYVKVTEVW